MVKEAGGEIYQTADWEKIRQRYRADLDVADPVPRELIWDLAMLHGAIVANTTQAEDLAKQLKAALAKSAN
jgi:hypothetical protein